MLTCTDIITEFGIDNERRIDIVIRNARFFIPIEVKIYADEQEGQCYDYYENARKLDADTKIVYLTRFKNEPSEYSRKEKNGTRILSMVMQYIDAIHIIADRRENKVMESTLEILYESADYFNAGIQIEKSMKTAKLRLIRLVFDDIKVEMDKIAPKYGLELETDALYYSYDEKRHEKFYDCDTTYPGLNYVVRNAKFQKESLQMWFRVEVDYNLFAGFCLFDIEAEPKGENLKGYQVDNMSTEIIDEAAQYLNRDIIMTDGWWFTWCYSNGKRQPDNYMDVPNFKQMNQCAIELVDNQKRKDFVKNTIGIFEKHLLKHLL